MTETVLIQIGNTDDKLSQFTWSAYCMQVRRLLARLSKEVHFIGGSPFDTAWQNACFVASIDQQRRTELLEGLTKIREVYGQDSVAVMFGNTEFV